MQLRNSFQSAFAIIGIAIVFGIALELLRNGSLLDTDSQAIFFSSLWRLFKAVACILAGIAVIMVLAELSEVRHRLAWLEKDRSDAWATVNRMAEKD